MYVFQNESTLYSCVNLLELLGQSKHEMGSLSDCNWTWTHSQIVHKRTLNHLAKPAKWLSRVMGTYIMVHSTLCSCHITYVFQRESTLYSSMNVKELLARNKRKIWSLSDCNWTRIYNHLVRKGKPNHLAKLAEWLSFVCEYLFVLYILSGCSCHVRYAFESESTLYSYLNAKELLAWSRCKIWILSDWNFTGTHKHLVRKRALNHFAKLAKSLSCVASTYL